MEKDKSIIRDRDMMTITEWKSPEGSMWIIRDAIRRYMGNTTYHWRDEIKHAGGKWDSAKKYWYFDNVEDADKLVEQWPGAFERQVRVSITCNCSHKRESHTYGDVNQVAVGRVIQCGCAWCDSGSWNFQTITGVENNDE